MKMKFLFVFLATLAALVQGDEHEGMDFATIELSDTIHNILRTVDLEREYVKLSTQVELFEAKERPLQEEKDNLLKSIESGASISKDESDFLEKYTRKDGLDLSFKLQFQGHLVRLLKVNQEFDIIIARVNAIRVADN